MLCLSGFELYSRWVPLLISKAKTNFATTLKILPYRLGLRGFRLRRTPNTKLNIKN